MKETSPPDTKIRTTRRGFGSLRMIGALCAALTLFGTAQADTLRIGTETDYWPYVFVDETGQRAGFDVDLMQLICERGAFDCVWSDVSFDQIITGVAEGQFDVSIGGIGATPKRDLLVDWTRPYRVMKSARNHFAALSKEVDVLSARIAVQRDTIMEDVLLANGYDTVAYPSTRAAVNAVLAGEVEAVFISWSYLSQVDHDGSALVDLGYLSYPDTGPQIAVAKAKPDLRRRLNKLLTDFEGDGSLTLLNAVWFPQGAEVDL